MIFFNKNFSKKQRFSESIYSNPNNINSAYSSSSRNTNYNFNLIIPDNTNYKKNNEYFFYSNRKDSYKFDNLLNMLTILDLNIEKLKNFDQNSKEFVYNENSQNKFGLFNSGIEINTNQNANPINKNIHLNDKNNVDKIKLTVEEEAINKSNY